MQIQMTTGSSSKRSSRSVSYDLRVLQCSIEKVLLPTPDDVQVFFFSSILQHIQQSLPGRPREHARILFGGFRCQFTFA